MIPIPSIGEMEDKMLEDKLNWLLKQGIVVYDPTRGLPTTPSQLQDEACKDFYDK